MGKIDYKKLEKEYMTSNTSLGQLCKKHGWSRSTVYQYAAKHEWAEKRKKVEQKRIEKETDEIVRVLDKQGDEWVKIKTIMITSLVQDWVSYSTGTSNYKVQELVKATKDARDMGVFGPTAAEQKTLIEIEALNKELNTSDADKTITIRIDGNEDYSK